MSDGAQIYNIVLARLAGSLSERQLLTFAQTVEGGADALLTLLWRHLRHDADAVHAALGLVLSRKTLALGATASRDTRPSATRGR